MPSQGRTALYRLFDADNKLLYVGIAANPHERWQLHASVQTWWGAVVVREVEWFATRNQALAAEARAIASEGPRWNKNAGQAPTRGAAGRAWSPDEAFKSLVSRFKRAEASAITARTKLEQAVVQEFRAGASAAAIADHCPWTDKAIYALAKSAGVPKLRKSTVVPLRQRPWEKPAG